MSLISFFEKLKHILNINLEGCSFSFINIQINSNNSSEKFESHKDGETLNVGINLCKLAPHERDELKSLIPQAVSDGTILLERESKERIEDIDLKEKSIDESDILSFFRERIPPDDFTALRASLYLRKRFKERADKSEIQKIKSDIIKRYGKRGRNISDLCSEGYFEKLIKPFFEELENSPDYTKEQILSIYELIVDEGTLTIFVSEGKTLEQVKKEIKHKLDRNRQYGIHFFYIHGIGRNNIETIRMCIYDLKESHSNIKYSISESSNIISVKLSF